MLHLFRSEEYCRRGNALGRRGWLVMGPLVLPTIERAGGWKMLPRGRYDCEMFTWRAFGAAGVSHRRIRVHGEYSHGRIHMHAANYPGQLKGCVAPGMRQTDGGVLESGAAMEAIFSALGGFGEKQQLVLLVH